MTTNTGIPRFAEAGKLYASGDVKSVDIGRRSLQVIAVGCATGEIDLFTVVSTKPVLKLSGHSSPIEAVRFCHEENSVVAGALSGLLKAWDLSTSQYTASFQGHRGPVQCIDRFRTHYIASGSMDNTIRLWDARTKGACFTYACHDKAVNSVQFSPDGCWLLTGSNDSSSKLLDLRAGAILHDFAQIHQGAVAHAIFHPLEMVAVSASNDRTVSFWDLDTAAQIGSPVRLLSSVIRVAFHPSGDCLYSLGSDGSVHVHILLDDQAPPQHAVCASIVGGFCGTPMAMGWLGHRRKELLSLLAAKGATISLHTLDPKNQPPFVAETPPIDLTVPEQPVVRPPPMVTRQRSGLRKTFTGITAADAINSNSDVTLRLHQSTSQSCLGSVESLSNAVHVINSNVLRHVRDPQNNTFLSRLAINASPTTQRRFPSLLSPVSPTSALIPAQGVARRSPTPNKAPDSARSHRAVAAVAPQQHSSSSTLTEGSTSSVHKATSARSVVPQRSTAIAEENIALVLARRKGYLDTARRLWAERGVKAAVEYVCKLNDDTVFVDLLNVLIHRKALWSLDVCLQLLPNLRDLLVSKNECQVHTAAKALRIVLRDFGTIIRNGLRRAPHIGVDVEQEQRSSKCRRCLDHVSSIGNTLVKHPRHDSSPLFKELLLLLNTFEQTTTTAR